MTLWDVIAGLLVIFVGLEFTRFMLRRRHERYNPRLDAVASLGAAAVAAFAINASQPNRNPPPPRDPTPPDQRRQKTPAMGIPVACLPDAGVLDGGPASMLAAEPETQMAGEVMAVDYEASDRFQPGRPAKAIQ